MFSASGIKPAKIDQPELMIKFGTHVLVGLILTLAGGDHVTAQESLGKCQVVNVDYILASDPLVVQSSHASYLARIGRGWNKGAASEVGVELFQSRGRDKYVRVAKYLLPQNKIPAHTLLTEEGVLLTIGSKYVRTQLDVVRIFSPTGRLEHEIDGRQVLSSPELEQSRMFYEHSPRCTPTNPWICWSNDPQVEDDALILTDTLGAIVSISIATGKIERKKGEAECRLFDANIITPNSRDSS